MPTAHDLVRQARAIHEAGHAVVAVHHRARLKSARLPTDGQGQVELFEFPPIGPDAEIALAGQEAVRMFMPEGTAYVSDAADYRPLLLEVLSSETWHVLRANVQQVLREREAAVRAVAEALLRHEVLPGHTIKAIVEREEQRERAVVRGVQELATGLQTLRRKAGLLGVR